MKIVVLKFGGTSVGTISKIKKLLVLEVLEKNIELLSFPQQ